MQDIELTGSREVLDELQSGRTRELLLLLQDKPVPEVVDPMNVQSSLSQNVEKSGGDYTLASEEIGSTSGNITYDNDDQDTPAGLIIEPKTSLIGVDATVGNDGFTTSFDEAQLIRDSDGTVLHSVTGNFGQGDTVSLRADLSSGTRYRILGAQFSGRTGTMFEPGYPLTSSDIDILEGVTSTNTTVANRAYTWESVTAILPTPTSGNVVDRYSAPTTAPADFKAWNAIRAQDVTTGGSTSAEPVEFEILDSSDTVLTSSRIPTSEIADEPFTLREREYQTSAGSDGQSDYQIAQTGNGGHYGIPILSVVTVSVAGNVLDPSNWTFDPTTSTVSIDTNNVTVSAGDTVTVTYDLDVFDSTLQPRAYLSREDTTEDSPSISHFRYEYVI